MGPSTTLVRLRHAASAMSKIAGDSSGPVRSVTCSTRSTTLGKSGNEVEDGIDEGVSRQHRKHRIHDRPRGRLADGGDAPLHVQSFVGGDQANDEGEDDALPQPDHEVAKLKRSAKLLD